MYLLLQSLDFFSGRDLHVCSFIALVLEKVNVLFHFFLLGPVKIGCVGIRVMIGQVCR